MAQVYAAMDVQRETVPEDQPRGFFSTMAADYRTTKMVRVQSPWLRGPQLILQSLILVYFVIFKVAYQLNFLKLSPIITQPLMQVEQPSTNFHTCTDIDEDCDDELRSLSDYEYCSNSMYNHTPCSHFDVHEVQPVKYQDQLFVATHFRYIKQQHCSEEDLFLESGARNLRKCKSLWNSKNEEKSMLVAGAEEFQLILKHSIISPKTGQMWSGVEMQGFLQDHDGHTTRLACYGVESCPSTASWNETYAPCGTSVPGLDTCFSGTRGDVISLGRLLKAAGVSLDDPDGRYRTHGVALVIEVGYLNTDPVDFWTWPWGVTNKYIYKVRRLPFEDQSRFKITQWHHLTTERQERILYSSWGILFMMSSHGMLGYVDPVNLIVMVAACMTMLNFADIFIKKVLLRIYSNVPCFHHVYETYAYYSQDFTPPCSELKEKDREAHLKDQLAVQSKHAHWAEKASKQRRQADRVENFAAVSGATGLLSAVWGLFSSNSEV
jgi:hypothetical protein